MVNHIEEHSVQSVSETDPEQHLMANVKGITIGVTQGGQVFAGRDVFFQPPGKALRRMTLYPDPVSMTMSCGTWTCALTTIEPEMT